MTWANYERCCKGYLKREQNKWRHTRELIAIHSKKTGRQLIPLPGDDWRAKDMKPLRPDQLKAIKDIFKADGRSK